MTKHDICFVIVHKRFIRKLIQNDPIKGNYLPVQLVFNLDESIVPLNIYERTCLSWFDEILKEFTNKRYGKFAPKSNWLSLTDFVLDAEDVINWLNRPFKQCKICDSDVQMPNPLPICTACEELITYDKIMTNFACLDGSQSKEDWMNSDCHKSAVKMLDILYKGNDELYSNHYIT